MSVNQRLIEFINKVTVQDIFSKTTLGQSGLYKARDTGGISSSSLEKIFNAYPQLNAEWLFRGVGEMWNTELHNSGNIAEPPPQYRTGKIKEVTFSVEKECGLTGGKCAFELVPELRIENEQLKKEIEILKKKRR